MDKQAGTSAKAGARRTAVATVLSHKMKQTVVVVIERKLMHPTYKKVVRKVTKLKAHDEKDECRVGDVVRIVESRPISKDKHWRVIEIVGRGRVIEAVPDVPTAS